MNKHVTSLEISQRLKALGVKQKSEIIWLAVWKNGVFIWELRTDIPYENYLSEYWCSAFLASEIGEMLGECLWVMQIYPVNKKWKEYKETESWACEYDDNITMLGSSMPNALALMLEYRIQNKMIGGR